jgi:hypothetical protein
MASNGGRVPRWIDAALVAIFLIVLARTLGGF